MDKRNSFRSIDVFIFDGVNILDVAGPVQAFDNALSNGKRKYHLRYVSLDGNPVTASCGLVLAAQAKLSPKSNADDLMIPGGGVDGLLDNKGLLAFISSWANRGGDSRVISICSGALLLAATGILDGKEATTHWARHGMVHDLFPNVAWYLGKIYTQDGPIYTSAGVSTGIDLALSIIGNDCGAAAALDVAQELVVFLKRSGSQSQFSNFLQSQYQLRPDIAALAKKIIAEPTNNWTLDSMAHEISMSGRTLSRKFIHQIGMTPVQFVEQTRTDHARNLLSNGASLQIAARASGFGSLQRMQRGFKRQLGVGAKEYFERFDLQGENASHTTTVAGQQIPV